MYIHVYTCMHIINACVCGPIRIHTCTNIHVHVYVLYLKVFKDPVERLQQRGGAILSAEDSKTIFGNIPEILAVHQNIVVSFRQSCRSIKIYSTYLYILLVHQCTCTCTCIYVHVCWSIAISLLPERSGGGDF